MTRLAAVVVAVGLVLGAVALRDRLDGDDGGGGGEGPGLSADELRLRCATEVRGACEELAADLDDVDVSVEPAGTTSDELVLLAPGEDPGFDAWLVAGPWAELTTDNRRFANADGAVLGDASEVLAGSPIVMAARGEVLAELAEACGGPPTWRCVGEQPAPLRIGLPSPEGGDGLVLLGGAGSSWFDTADYSATDLGEPGFSAWFTRLTELSSSTNLGEQTPLARALAAAGTFDVVGALETESDRLLADRGGWEAIYPEPMAIAEVQLAPRAGLGVDEVLERLGDDRLREALGSTGWRTDVESGDDGLPAPGVLQVLREMW